MRRRNRGAIIAVPLWRGHTCTGTARVDKMEPKTMAVVWVIKTRMTGSRMRGRMSGTERGYKDTPALVARSIMQVVVKQCGKVQKGVQ